MTDGSGTGDWLSRRCWPGRSSTRNPAIGPARRGRLASLASPVGPVGPVRPVRPAGPAGPVGPVGTHPRERVGLVLGAGGVVGAAWMTGALQAVQDRLPRAINDIDLIVGTSAGSVLAAALRCGVSLDEMIALQRGDEVRWLREAGVGDLDEGPLPPRPQWRPARPG